MLDVTELFVQRVQKMRGSDTPLSVDTLVPPWKLLEGKGYPSTDGAVIVEPLSSCHGRSSRAHPHVERRRVDPAGVEPRAAL